MKKGSLFLVCLLLFAVTAGAGAAWLRLSPEGALRPDLPETVLAAYLADKSPDFWREEYLGQITLPATEFEDGAAVLGRLYDAAVADDRVRFSPLSAESGGDARSFLITVGGADLFRAVTRYRDGTWQVTELSAREALAPAAHEITVLLPSDAALTVNGRPVGEAYIEQQGLDYPDMSPLERRLPEHPTRALYRIAGLYEAPSVEVSREGGLVLLRREAGEWEYTVPDAAGYAFAAEAPREAVVLLGGLPLGSENIAASSVYVTALDVPAELQGYLPEYVTYTAGGLYTPPVLTAETPEGAPLTGSESGGVLRFSLPGTDELREAHHQRAEDFLRAMTTYGSGNGALASVTPYVSPSSPVLQYLSGAAGSLYWTHYVTLTFQDVTADGFLPLGEDAFLCRARAEFTTKTWYQTKELSWDFEMLWRREDGAWKLWDLAFL